MKRSSQLKLTKGLVVLFTLGVTLILYSAIPDYYQNFNVQAQLQQQLQPPPVIGVKITSPTTGQQVPVGQLTISGTSTDNATTDCTVYADWNNLKPFQTATATGPGGANDYSSWTFTYTQNYHLITNGTNNLTSKLSCVGDDSNGGTTSNISKSYSVNVIGVTGTTTPTNNLASTTSTSEQVQEQQQESPIIDRNITTKMEEITNVTTTASPESVPSIPTSPSVPLSPSIKEQQQQEEDTTIYWDLE